MLGIIPPVDSSRAARMKFISVRDHHQPVARHTPIGDENQAHHMLRRY
jgi:hypothetical protein